MLLREIGKLMIKSIIGFLFFVVIFLFSMILYIYLPEIKWQIIYLLSFLTLSSGSQL